MKKQTNISNNQIKQLNNKCLKFPSRKHNNLTKDYNSFIDHMENDNSNNNKIDFNQKLSSQQIIDLMNRLQFHELSKNVFSDKQTTITIKPQKSLIEVIRLYGHMKYTKHRDIDLKSLDTSPDISEETFLSRIFNLFC